MGEQERALRFTEIVPSTNTHCHQLSIEALADTLLAFAKDIQDITPVSAVVDDFNKRFFPLIEQLKEVRIKESDFQTIKVLGKGAFGEVRLVRYNLDNKVYAMKLMRKSKMLTEREAAFFKEERDVMAQSKSQWITQLHFAFQDDENLFLVMEYLQGGSLLNVFFKNDLFTEEQTKFYIAEIVLAVDEMHQMGYCHRDLKPDNLMLDSKGHIKLTDFGSAIKFDSRGKIHSDIPVGTPEYISPEVLQAQEKGASVGKECDWWAVGIMMYEMLMGEVPFNSENIVQLYGMIMNHKKNLTFSEEISISDDAKDLMKRFICDRAERIGAKNGTKEIFAHPFFKGLDPTKLREQTPPFVPVIKDETDTSNFEEDEDNENNPLDVAPMKKSKGFQGNELPFIGYTFNRNFQYVSSQPNAHTPISRQDSAKMLISSKKSQEEIGAYQAKIEKLDKQVEEARKSLEVQIKKSQELEKTNNTLTQELETSQEEWNKTKSKSENEIKLYTEQIEKLKQDKGNLSDQIQELNQKSKDQQQKMISLSADTEKAQGIVQTLQNDQESLQNELSTLKAQLRKSQSQAKEKEDLTLTLNEQLAILKNEMQITKANLESKLKETQDQLNEERQSQESLSGKKNEFDGVIAGLQAKIDEQQAILKSTQESQKLQEKNLKEITIEKTNLETNLKRYEDESVLKDKKVEELQNQLEVLSEKNETVSKEFELLQNKFSEKEEALSSLQATNKENKKDIASLNMELTESKYLVEQLRASELSLNKEISNLKTNLTALTEMRETELNKQLNEEHSKLENVQTTFKQELQLSEIKINQLQEKLQQEIAQKEVLLDEKKKIALSKTELELALTALKESLSANEALLKEERENLKKSNDLVSSIGKEKNGFEKELSKTKGEYTSLCLQNDLTKKQLEEVSNKNKSLSNEIEELKNQLESESSTYKDLQTKLNDAISQQQTLQTTISTTSNLNTSQKATISQLETKIGLLEKNILDLQIQNEGLTQRCTTLTEQQKRLEQDHIQELENVRVPLEEKVTREVQARKKAEEELSSTKTQLQTLRMEHDLSQETIQKQDSKIQEYETLINQGQIEQENLKKTISDLEIKRDSLERGNAKLQNKMAEDEERNEKIIQELRGELEQKIDTLETTEMNLTEANKIREELKAAQEATSEELKAIKIENIKLIDTNKQMKSAMDTFTLNPVKTPKQTRALKQESTKLQQDLENEKKLRKKLESEISTLKSQLHEAQSSLEQMKTEKKSLQSQIEKSTPQTTNNTQPAEGGIINMFRSRSVRMSVNKPKQDPIAIPYSDKIDGPLALRVSKGGIVKWNKLFADVKDLTLYLFEKEDHKDNLSKAKEKFDLKSTIFIVRGVGFQHLRNHQPEELPLIFGIWISSGKGKLLDYKSASKSASVLSFASTSTSTSNTSSFDEGRVNELQTSEIEDRLKKTQMEIQKEEALLKGAKSMLLITKGPQKESARAESEACERRLARLFESRDRYNTVLEERKKNPNLEPVRITVSEEGDKDKENEKRRQIELDIEKEQQTLAGFKKMLQLTDSSKQRASIKNQITESNGKIEKLKAELENPMSFHMDEDDIVEDLGHHFRMKQFITPTECLQCHELITLFQASNKGYECSHCHFACHKQCQPRVTLTCEDSNEAKSFTPYYFKALDENDKRRWVIQLQRFRDTYQNEKDKK